MLEFAVFAPWFLFIAAGVLDWGFYSYALISVQNAARGAALYTSSSSGSAADSATACALVLGELRSLPNISPQLSTCGGDPLVVSAEAVTGPDNQAASRVTVTYTTVPLIPIPGILSGQITIRRTVELKV